ncbi:MAG TPA: replication factor C small subunit [Nitrososphaeraceae archaeon]|jgi:replication factor C small subunit|nr:replication factor C small subunit [Nitrososphaeraceae archaeon]HYZ65153.1 replication factor C small subunit [Nitrososphaeraceae archaeon]
MTAVNTDLSNLMWVEKYRPANLKEIINQRDIVNGLSNFSKEPDEIPHLLFSGPAGVGKTTTALCLAKELLGESWRTDTLELNASDERGIKMVRERVKEFAAVMKLPTDRDNKKMFRIIILDEADEMTSEAQTALRRIIEDSSRTTRFIIICNYLSQIIEPIQSRCVVFKFRRLSREDVSDYLRFICEKQGVRFEEKAFSTIYDSTLGDLRHSINILQAAAGMGAVSSSNVASSIGLSGKTRVKEIIKLALAGKFHEARFRLFELMQVYGMSENDFLKYANQEAYDLKLDRPDEFAALMAEYDYRLVTGAHPEIQLVALLAQLSKLRSNPK